MPNATCIAADVSRRVIRVFGEESTDFLQSLVTANVEELAPGACGPGALLTPQGRILADMMIFRREEGYLLDCDEARAADLFTRLRRYRLRRPIDLVLEQDLRVWVGWDANMPAEAAADPRHPDLGWRWIGPDGTYPPGFDGDSVGPVTLWHARRIAAGVPQGPVDLVPERALMLEAGLDRLGAVDFSKGCYVGQEVTARTHYRGLVKRRIVPLRIDAEKVPDGAVITEGEAVIGSILSQAADGPELVCLAAMKLSDLHRLLDDGGEIFVDGYPARPALPDWMLPLPDPARTDKA
jgi:folate-binding protein YgfZ